MDYTQLEFIGVGEILIAMILLDTCETLITEFTNYFLTNKATPFDVNVYVTLPYYLLQFLCYHSLSISLLLDQLYAIYISLVLVQFN